MFDSAKFTDGDPLPILAITLYGPPAVPFAVNVGAVATPLALVATVAGLPPVKAPLAPLAGGVKVTVTPLWLLPLSLTVACNAVPNGVLMVALWDEPAAAVIA